MLCCIDCFRRKVLEMQVLRLNAMKLTTGNLRCSHSPKFSDEFVLRRAIESRELKAEWTRDAMFQFRYCNYPLTPRCEPTSTRNTHLSPGSHSLPFYIDSSAGPNFFYPCLPLQYHPRQKQTTADCSAVVISSHARTAIFWGQISLMD